MKIVKNIKYNCKPLLKNVKSKTRILKNIRTERNVDRWIDIDTSWNSRSTCNIFPICSFYGRVWSTTKKFLWGEYKINYGWTNIKS